MPRAASMMYTFPVLNTALEGLGSFFPLGREATSMHMTHEWYLCGITFSY